MPDRDVFYEDGLTKVAIAVVRDNGPFVCLDHYGEDYGEYTIEEARQLGRALLAAADELQRQISPRTMRIVDSGVQYPDLMTHG